MQPKLLNQVITERIRSLIISGELKMGDKISENRLAEMFSVGKAPVRDALKILQNERLVYSKPKSGTFVFSMDKAEFNQLLDFRIIIEGSALKILFEQYCQVAVQELQVILHNMQNCYENNYITEYLRLDDQFHQILVTYSGNSYLLDAYSLFSARMATLRTLLANDKEHTERSFNQHKEIVEFLIKKDLDSAMNELLNHISPKHGSYWQNKILSFDL